MGGRGIGARREEDNKEVGRRRGMWEANKFGMKERIGDEGEKWREGVEGGRGWGKGVRGEKGGETEKTRRE